MRYSTSLLLATALSAQVAPFSQPVTTDDGQTIYFLSPLVLTTAPAPVAPTGGSNSSVTNLYSLGDNGIELLSASATGPQVSGNGNLVGYTDPNVCVTTGGSTSCGRRAMLLGRAGDLGAGTLQLSRNGRWAVVSSLPFQPAPADTMLINTATGARVALPGTTPIGSLSVVASDGTVLLQQTGTNQIGLWRDGQFTPQAGIRPSALSADGSTLIYSAIETPATTVRWVARNVASGAEMVLAEKVPSRMVLMGLTNDGHTILFRVVTNTTDGSGTAYVAAASTGKAVAIALPEGEAVFDGTLSGLGNSVILTTTLGRVLQSTVTGGAGSPVYEVLPATPYLNLQSSASVGSYAALMGTTTSSVQGLTGKLVLGGVPLAILAVKPGEVDAQIPWEVPVGYQRFQNLSASNSPFKQDQMIFASGFGPRYFSLPAGQTSILGPLPLIRGDFSGFQTTQPQAGDIVVLYMAGLGPVQGSPVTGQPAPVTPLHPLIATLACRFTPQTTNAKTLYAGLAPGMVGIYQVVFQMPVDANTAPLSGMQCSYSGPGIGGSFIFQQLTTPVSGN